jgi:hypothetical protein
MDTLYSINLISSLSNIDKFPFMVPMTCLEGSFDYPSFPGTDNSSLSERMVREPMKGAIASFGPLGFGIANGHDFLNKGLFLAFFTDNVTKVGAASTQAKLYLYANSGGLHHDLIDTYALLGDPALKLSIAPIFKYFKYFPFVLDKKP